ncbi:McrB family protein [Microbulbifer magnicolonia]|uniref:McrB family protein n=1 Tax=Microbulbifer magnicolonia TaxID=3109744 RepID=UPI002B40BDEB|nr:AAA family ATPase [Microbulbifer sp. GG15]
MPPGTQADISSLAIIFGSTENEFLHNRIRWKERYSALVQRIAGARNSGEISDELLRDLWYTRSNGVADIKTGAIAEDTFAQIKEELRELTKQILAGCSEDTYRTAIAKFQEFSARKQIKGGVLRAVVNRVFAAIHPDKCTTAVASKAFKKLINQINERCGTDFSEKMANWLQTNIALKSAVNRLRPENFDDIDTNIVIWRLDRESNPQGFEDTNAASDEPLIKPAGTAEADPFPLNQILYGPPGTGKTYKTTSLAVQIADPIWCAAQSAAGDGAPSRAALKQRYDELVAEKRVVFTTFHQSFSYEDFIEGIRAENDGHGALRYPIKDGIFKKLCGTVDGSEIEPLPHVLIIDEINRGNISRIFGELITLLEPEKRRGADDAREVILPYSKDPFSVPDHVYVIGTMNTADKSLAQLDLALRRRFSFIEMPPEPESLSDVHIYGVNIGAMLAVINQRIEVLLDRDHLIGHSYLLPLKKISDMADREKKLQWIFEKQVLPLLQEYFFDDWQRISWVLNDNDKPEVDRFIRAGGTLNRDSLFSADVAEQISDRRYYVNFTAFGRAGAYTGIMPGSRNATATSTALEAETTEA